MWIPQICKSRIVTKQIGACVAWLSSHKKHSTYSGTSIINSPPLCIGSPLYNGLVPIAPIDIENLRVAKRVSNRHTSWSQCNHSNKKTSHKKQTICALNRICCHLHLCHANKLTYNNYCLLQMHVEVMYTCMSSMCHTREQLYVHYTTSYA